MTFAGMALGFRDESHPLSRFRTRREPFEIWGELRGFD
jgi:hypothetical protein